MSLLAVAASPSLGRFQVGLPPLHRLWPIPHPALPGKTQQRQLFRLVQDRNASATTRYKLFSFGWGWGVTLWWIVLGEVAARALGPAVGA